MNHERIIDRISQRMSTGDEGIATIACEYPRRRSINHKLQLQLGSSDAVTQCDRINWFQ